MNEMRPPPEDARGASNSRHSVGSGDKKDGKMEFVPWILNRCFLMFRDSERGDRSMERKEGVVQEVYVWEVQGWYDDVVRDNKNLSQGSRVGCVRFFLDSLLW